jgi:exosortase family protein XrtF
MKGLNKPNVFIRFILISTFLYAFLYLVYQFIVKKYTYYDQNFIGLIINSADFLLNLFGFKTYKVLQDRDMQVIGIDGANGVWIGSPCNAITLFALFTVFIVAYPGNQKHKFWYIPIGILIIHLLNIFRVLALAMISFYRPDLLEFNHTYTFTFIIYGVIFLLWLIWVNKFSEKINSNS